MSESREGEEFYKGHTIRWIVSRKTNRWLYNAHIYSVEGASLKDFVTAGKEDFSTAEEAKAACILDMKGRIDRHEV